MKQCSKCGEIKLLLDFHKQKASKDSLSYWCKKCSIENIKQWKINNKNWLRKYQRSKKYKEKRSKRQKKQMENPKNRIDKNVSVRLRQCLKKDEKAGRGWETLVGYTLQDLMTHLEKQFDDKMSWQNYGKYWHLDHIVPVSWFPYQTAEEQAFKNCWELKNLQPLEIKANLIKNNHFIS